MQTQTANFTSSALEAYRLIAARLGAWPELRPVPATDPRAVDLAGALGDDAAITRRTVAEGGRWAYLATASDGRAAWMLAGPGWEVSA